MTRRMLWTLLGLLALLLPPTADAQTHVRLHSLSSSITTFDGDGDEVTLDTRGLYGSLLIDINGAIGGGSTITVSCSADDGTTYDARPLNGPYPATTEDTDGAVTTTGQYTASIVGCTKVRAVASAWGTGSPLVRLVASSSGGASSGGGGGTTFDGVLKDASGGDSVMDTANDAVRVNVVTGGGSGGTSVNEDVASADAHPGTPAYTVRNNTLTGATGTDGDYQPAKSTAAGALYIAPTFGDTVAAVNNGAASAQTQRVTIANDSTGILAAVTNVATIGTSVTPGTGATHLGKAEDAVAASGDSGVMALAVRANTPAATGANGDYVPLLVDTNNRLHTATVLYSEAGAALTPATDKAEDAAHTDADTGPVLLERRIDVAASSAGTSGDYATKNQDALGLSWTRLLDPCSGVAKTYLPIDIVTATTTEITSALAGASTHYYICSIALVTAGANNVAIVDDDTDNCASVTSGVMGGFGSAAEGFNLAANGGLTIGNGNGSVARTNGTNRVLCIITSAAVQLSGTITVVAAP